MNTPILTCTNCRAIKPEPDGTPTDLYPSEHCDQCPPWTCETCGETCSAAALCRCWTSLDGMATADIKALFAADGGFHIQPVPDPPNALEQP